MIYLEAAKRISNSDVPTRILEAGYAPRLADVPLATRAKGKIDCIDLITQLRIIVGQNKDHDKDQLKVEAKYIQRSFGNFSLDDFYIAIELFLNAKLDIAIPDHITFSPMFIAKFMNSYNRYRMQVMKRIDEISERDVLMLQDNDKAKRLKGLKDCLWECAMASQEDFKNRFFNGFVYDFLKKTKRLLVNAEVNTKSKKYAERKFLDDRKAGKEKKEKKAGVEKKLVRIGEALEKTPAEIMPRLNAENEYRKDYFLKYYFEKTDINKLLESITEADL